MQKLIAGLAVAVMAVFAVAGSVQAADDADLFQEHPWTLSAGGGFITRENGRIQERAARHNQN